MAGVNVSCPVCGSAYPLEAGLNDADARRFAALMGELQPPVARLMMRYLELFKPQKQGLRWSRRLSIAGEIVPAINAAQVTRDGVTHAAPQELWVAGLDKVLAKTDLVLPLSGNGLLLKIVAGLAAAGEVRGERDAEVRMSHRHHRQSTGGPVPVADVAKSRSKPPKGWKDQLKGDKENA